MLNRNFTVRSINGTAPSDGSPLMLKCDKRDGLTLFEVRGFSKTPIRRIDPESAAVFKVGEGRFNAWTGKRHGLWDACVRHADGATTFRMKSKGDALALKAWVEKFASSGR